MSILFSLYDAPSHHGRIKREQNKLLWSSLHRTITTKRTGVIFDPFHASTQDQRWVAIIFIECERIKWIRYTFLVPQSWSFRIQFFLVWSRRRFASCVWHVDMFFLVSTVYYIAFITACALHSGVYLF